MPKPTIRKFIIKYWVHLLILGFLAGFVVRQTVRYFAAADNCISQEQWTTMSQDHGHCYVQYDRNGIQEVWEPPKDDSGWTHKENQICGTNITSIIPASHLAEPNKYTNIGARFVGTIGACAVPTNTPAPTETPTPIPTDIPTPTITLSPDVPTPTPTDITTTITTTPTIIPTSVPTPTPTLTSSGSTNPSDPTPTSGQLATASDPTPTLKIIPTAVVVVKKQPAQIVILGSQVVTNSSIIFIFGVLGLWMYLKIKNRKPGKSPASKGKTYTVKVSRVEEKGTWVDLVNSTDQLEGWYALPGKCPEGVCIVDGILKIYPPNTSYLEITSIVPVVKK